MKQHRRRPHNGHKRVNGHVGREAPRQTPIKFFYVPALDPEWTERVMRAAHEAFEGWPGVVCIRVYQVNEGKAIAYDLAGLRAVVGLIHAEAVISATYEGVLDPRVCVATREVP